jgi:hypothetical protein
VSLTSAERKFVRGLEQVAEICREVKDFESANAYELRTERNVRAEEIEYTCFAVERQGPDDDWSLQLGDAIHNLRASLDHAVYAASGGAGGTKFPITRSESEFEGRGRPVINKAPAAVRQLIEKAQPFNTSPEYPEAAPLAFLAELSNADKHRELTTVAAAVVVPGFGWEGPESDMRFTDTGEGRDLHDGTKVMAFTVSGPRADQVKVGPMFAYEVRVEGIHLGGSLQRIAHAVWKSVSECEFGEPFPMLTPQLFRLLPDGQTEYPAAPFFPSAT